MLDRTLTGSAWASGCSRKKNLLLGELEKVSKAPFKKLFFKKKLLTKTFIQELTQV